MSRRYASLALRAAVLAFGLCALAHCHVYDNKLASIPDGQHQGAVASMRTSGEPQAPVDAGQGPLIIEAGIPPHAPPDDDTQVPDGPPARIMTHEEDAGPGAPTKMPAAASCGDGEVNGAEKCDTGIADGRPGACPRACPALEPCVPRVLNGTGCQAECVLREVSCQSGDDCCPGKCTKDNDLDCSAKCGDGIVQDSSGETCEPGTDKPCLTSAADCDDHDPCTQDELQGSATNCNTRCTHLAARALPGDGCCPDGENANTDSDCVPRCGNNVRELGEACDGSPGCEPDCKLASDADTQRCIAGAKNACERCACVNCTGTEVACRLSADASTNALCGGVVSCMQSNNCVGNPLASCYCGVTLICGLPYGACRTQVEAAGKSTDFDTLYNLMNDRNTPLGRAATADLCRVTRCLDECR